MIHHVTRAVRRSALRDCVSFYEILGFRQVEVPPGVAGRAIWLESGAADRHSQVHLMPVQDAEQRQPEPETGHFALVAAEYDAMLDRLRDAGVEVDRRREHWGAPRCYVHDPAGNLVELMAWPPSDHRRPQGAEA